MQNYIKCWFAKRQEIITEPALFQKPNSTFVWMSKIYVQILKIQKHIHQFNFPTSFYSFRHSLILCKAAEKTYC